MAAKVIPMSRPLGLRVLDNLDDMVVAMIGPAAVIILFDMMLSHAGYMLDQSVYPIWVVAQVVGLALGVMFAGLFAARRLITTDQSPWALNLCGWAAAGLVFASLPYTMALLLGVNMSQIQNSWIVAQVAVSMTLFLARYVAFFRWNLDDLSGAKPKSSGIIMPIEAHVEVVTDPGPEPEVKPAARPAIPMGAPKAPAIPSPPAAFDDIEPEDEKRGMWTREELQKEAEGEHEAVLEEDEDDDEEAIVSAPRAARPAGIASAAAVPENPPPPAEFSADAEAEAGFGQEDDSKAEEGAPASVKASASAAVTTKPAASASIAVDMGSKPDAKGSGRAAPKK